jgi:hypothetical protein
MEFACMWNLARTLFYTWLCVTVTTSVSTALHARSFLGTMKWKFRSHPSRVKAGVVIVAARTSQIKQREDPDGYSQLQKDNVFHVRSGGVFIRSGRFCTVHVLYHSFLFREDVSVYLCTMMISPCLDCSLPCLLLSTPLFHCPIGNRDFAKQYLCDVVSWCPTVLSIFCEYESYIRMSWTLLPFFR